MVVLNIENHNALQLWCKVVWFKLTSTEIKMQKKNHVNSRIFNDNEQIIFQAVIGLEAAHAEGQSSSDWLGTHSVKAGGLSFEEIMKCGIPIK